MTALVHSTTGVVHLAATLLAIGTGTYCLVAPKGTPRHRYVGRVYAGSMLLVLTTAFGIYALFGRFGLVHWGAVGSALALLGGTASVALRARLRHWRRGHYLGMGASVLSLYVALAGESSYRLLPASYFWWSTLGPASIVFLVGLRLLYQHYPTPRQ